MTNNENERFQYTDEKTRNGSKISCRTLHPYNYLLNAARAISGLSFVFNPIAVQPGTPYTSFLCPSLLLGSQLQVKQQQILLGSAALHCGVGCSACHYPPNDSIHRLTSPPRHATPGHALSSPARLRCCLHCYVPDPNYTH